MADTNGTTTALTAADRVKERTSAIVRSGSLKEAKSSDIVAILSQFEGQIAQALPKAAQDLSAQRIIQIAATIIGGNDKLKECSPSSVVGAVMQAAILGLNPMPSMAECYFVPFQMSDKVNGKWVKRAAPDCQMQIGYKGFVNIYHRGRIIGSVTCGAVAQGDEFSYKLGTGQFLNHVPLEDVAPNGSNLTHSWALARYNNGHEVFVVLTKKRIEELRKRSPMAQFAPEKLSGGWEKDYAAMAMAKVLKQLKRTIPTDSSIDAALATDERVVRVEDFRPTMRGELDLAKIETANEVLAEIEVGNATASGDEVHASHTEAHAAVHELPTDKKPSEVRENPDGSIAFDSEAAA